jgi:ureidoacrylate peracid hydrolase
MHKVHIPEDAIERGRAMRGTEHILAEIDPKKTAHIIVDLQNGFMQPGAPVEVPGVRDIVGNVNKISNALRSAGGLNVFLRFTYDGGEPLPWRMMYEKYTQASYATMMREAFTPGADYHALWSGLDVRAEDAIVDKTRFSAFIPGTCSLHDLLQGRGIDTLIITGTVTNCCCESTARDAMQMNYGIIFVTDGNGAFTDAEHNATLTSMAAIFADVMTTDEVLGAIGGAESERSAA